MRWAAVILIRDAREGFTLQNFSLFVAKFGNNFFRLGTSPRPRVSRLCDTNPEQAHFGANPLNGGQPQVLSQCLSVQSNTQRFRFITKMIANEVKESVGCL